MAPLPVPKLKKNSRSAGGALKNTAARMLAKKKTDTHYETHTATQTEVKKK